MASITASTIGVRAVAGRKTFMSGNSRVSAVAPKAVKRNVVVRAEGEVRCYGSIVRGKKHSPGKKPIRCWERGEKKNKKKNRVQGVRPAFVGLGDPMDALHGALDVIDDRYNRRTVRDSAWAPRNAWRGATSVFHSDRNKPQNEQ